MSSQSSPAGEAFLALGVMPSIAEAMVSHGFTAPTPVQAAMLDRALDGRDVLVSSQTGSGKTVAFGLLLVPSLETRSERPQGACTPRAVVITPTRELAMQVREELAWLLAPLGARVLAVTGGTSVGGELRSLNAGVDVLVGTPGRLNDHLSRGAVDASRVGTVVLDEADEMLDMGFRDELEAILQLMPAERRTVMLSATLPRDIVALARKYQRDAAKVSIDPPGTANENIAHVAHLIPTAGKFDALVNVLLGGPDERTLIFTRTRADASEIGAKLSELGFATASLTGEMAQRERTQTLDAFRAGRVTALVATDVAARGIDVPEISRVVHVDLPENAETFTHRSGRTGRAGRKGTSILLVPSFARTRAGELLRGAGVRAHWRGVPTGEEIYASAETRLRTKLNPATGDESAPATPPAARNVALAESLLRDADPTQLVARLLSEFRWEGPCDVRTIQPPPAPREKRAFGDRPMRAPYGDNGRPSFGDNPRPSFGDAPRAPRGGREADSHVMFRTNFGERQGATPARLLAMVCRRGGVRGQDVGAISIGTGGSTFGVSREVAQSFAQAASRTDAREPHVRIELLGDRAAEPRVDAPHSDSPRPAPRPVGRFERADRNARRPYGRA